MRRIFEAGYIRLAGIAAAVVFFMASTPAAAHGHGEGLGPDGDLPPISRAPTASAHEEPDEMLQSEPVDPQGAVNDRDPYGEVITDGPLDQLPPSLAGCEIHADRLLGGINLRSKLGLSLESDRVAATEVRYGIWVTPSDARFLDGNVAARSKIDLSIVAKGIKRGQGDEFLGNVWDPVTGTMEVLLAGPEGKTAGGRANVERRANEALASDLPAAARRIVKPKAIALDLLAADVIELRSELIRSFSESREGASIGSSIDPTCGKILFSVADEDSEKIVATLAAEISLPDSTYYILVDSNQSATNADRYDFHNPYIGGLGVDIAGGSGADCTTSIAMRSNSYTYMITAAHCLPNSTENWSSTWHSNVDWEFGGIDMNNWSGSRYIMGGNLDIAWTQLNPVYSADRTTIIHGGNHTTVGMGWWKWDPILTAFREPVCHSGLNWGGAVCGRVADLDWEGVVNAGQRTERNHDGMMVGDMTACAGDSGSTIWTDSFGVWYVGVLSFKFGSPCGGFTGFSHIGNFDNAVSYIKAPVTMS